MSQYRIAVIDKDLCQPRKCSTECIRFCPLVRTGKKAIYMDEELKRPVITSLCTACGICIKKCPFKAITIVNLPAELSEECIYQYGPSGFKLFKLPILKLGKVVGILGQNALGKTTIAKILSGELKPNFCRNAQASTQEVIKYFRGTELQNYFTQLYNGKLRVVHKIQYVEIIPNYIRGKVMSILLKISGNDYDKVSKVAELLNMKHILERDVKHLSGGELQKLAIAAAILKDADVYIMDEPTTHLDVVERLRVCHVVKDTVRKGKYSIIIDHDLAVLDYLADLVVILYGKPGAYGIVSSVKGSREGINEYLQGYLSKENMLIRDYTISFKVKPPERTVKREKILIEWTGLKKVLGDFRLEVKEGYVCRGEVVGIIGPNGIGKTTFAKILVNEYEPDEGVVIPHGEVRISYKPQYVREYALKYTGKTVHEFLTLTVSKNYRENIYWNELANGLILEPLMDREVESLSGGELQRVVIASTLLRDAEIYLLDEPMAYLDIEQRIRIAALIKRIIEEKEAIALIIEHDITSLDYMSTCIMPFLGEAGRFGIAYPPMNVREGMNMFLKLQDVTFRREPRTGRPRINKKDSVLDRVQRQVGEYYYYVSEREEE